MPNATINDRTLRQALAAAAQKEKELPQIIQVSPHDWDIVILAHEILRLKEVLNSLYNKSEHL